MTHRVLEPEMMDDQQLPTDRLRRALRELSLINRWLGGHRTSRIGIQTLLRDIPSGKKVTILDVAAGGTDLSAVLGGGSNAFDITVFDLNPRMVSSAQSAGAAAHYVVGSAHAIPFRDATFDIVHISLFLHHCTDSQALDLLRASLHIARVGVVVNDLHRHRLASAAIFALTRLLSRSDVVRHDSVVSVRRGFTRNDLYALAGSLNAIIERLTWQWAFRWCLCIRKVETADLG